MSDSEYEIKGWVTMERKNGKVHYNKNIKPMEKKTQKKITMEETILKMERNWYQYEVQYDSIHGQGAYREKFVLPNVYPEVSESDTESEEDNSGIYEEEWEPELDKWKEWN
jgi:hypothetical protein